MFSGFGISLFLFGQSLISFSLSGMSGRKNGRNSWYAVLLAMICALMPVQGNVLFETSWAQEADEEVPGNIITGMVTWSEDRVVTEEMIVEPGATLIIPKGVTVEFGEFGSLLVQGVLRVEGSVERPVFFRKQAGIDGAQYSITADGAGLISIRNADISGGGRAVDAILVADHEDSSWLSQARATWSYVGAVGAVSGGTLDIEGANFHHNGLAVFVDSASSRKAKVWRSKFSHNERDIVGSGYAVDARYNWWDREGGPAPCSEEAGEDSDGCDRHSVYEKVIGTVTVSDWATEEDFKDPVIILPGILGSWRWTPTSELVLDPILGSYDSLVETFEKNGYTKDKDLFPFPYEWRESNVDTALLLKEKVKAIEAEAKWPRVDIVAHSMGGLVAREYIETDSGVGAVDQLVTLGTPEGGAPNSYLTWGGGEIYADSFLLREAYKGIFTQEAKENGYDTVFDYIRNAPIPSVRELLPTYSYLRDKDSGDLRSYPNLTPRNTFLERLNSGGFLEKLDPVSFTAIVGKTSDNKTIKTIRVEDPSIEIMNDSEKAVLWGYGKPDGYDDFSGDRGLELGKGDGMVPIESAMSIPADETVEVDSVHTDLPEKSAERVFRVLTGHDPKKEAASTSIDSLLAFFVFSPVDIQVVSPSGKRMGKDFSTGKFLNDIPGAYYTGFDTKNEFITIPNPEKGNYTVLIEGTDTGSYRVETSLLRAEESGDGEVSTVEITGDTTSGEHAEKKVEVTEAGVAAQEERDTTPPGVSIVSPESTTYQNTEMIALTFSASDDKTLPEHLQQEVLLDESPYSEKTIDASLLSLGAHVVRVRATDEAENIGEATASFTLETSWESLLENITHYRVLGLFKHEPFGKSLEVRAKVLFRAEQFFRSQAVFFEKHAALKAIALRTLKNQIDAFEQDIQRQSGAEIDAHAADRIVESLEFLKGRL